MKRLIDIDPMSGIHTYHEYDSVTKLTTITTSSPNVLPLLNQNQGQYNDDDLKKQGIKNGMWKVASIDAQTIHQWMQEGINIWDKNCHKEVLKKLSDRDFRKFRTSAGNII